MNKQGDIVLVNFPLPKGLKLHPAVIISNADVFEAEECYIGVMLISSIIRDNFSFVLTNEMLTSPLNKQSQVRCQLIALFQENEIEKKVNALKKESLKNLIKQINETVLNIESDY